MHVHLYHQRLEDQSRKITVSLSPSWSTQQILGQPMLHNETLLGKKEKDKKHYRAQAITQLVKYVYNMQVCDHLRQEGAAHLGSQHYTRRVLHTWDPGTYARRVLHT